MEYLCLIDQISKFEYSMCFPQVAEREVREIMMVRIQCKVKNWQASRYLAIDFGSGRKTACATLGLGLAVSAFPLYVPV